MDWSRGKWLTKKEGTDEKQALLCSYKSVNEHIRGHSHRSVSECGNQGTLVHECKRVQQPAHVKGNGSCIHVCKLIKEVSFSRAR